MSGRTGVLSPRGAAHGGLADLAEPTVAMADQRLDRRRRRRHMLRLARRGGAWLCVGLLVVALGGALASGGRWLLMAPRFAVERVEVAGQSQLSVDQVVAASGLSPGQNLFRLDARRAVAGVEALPMVRRAELVRAFPNRVTLLVEERQPFVLVHAGGLHWPAGGFYWPAGGFYWVDEQGVPLGPETRAVALDAPLVSAAGADDVAAAGRTSSERVAAGVALIRTLMRAQSPLLREISEVDVSRPEGPVLYMLDGVEVRLGREDWDDRLGRLGGVLAQLRASGQRATSIDLRFRDQVVLRTAAR
ncbi:MAG TPA: cell division protein FtsQ/DivIB [Methylomirabilota bacterium]|nr:cell division protein FtsQ/DivIB [Methylomirabilota bacterium]